MKQLILLAVLALGSAAASAQKLQSRNISGFNAVNVQNGIEVFFTQGPTESVTIEYPDAGAPRDLVTDCHGTELKLYMKDNSNCKGVKVHITRNSLSSIAVGTGASFHISGTLDVPTVTIALATGGLLEGATNCTGTCSLKAGTTAVAKAHITAGAFKGVVTGGATVKLAGKTNAADVFCSGGTVLAGRFTATGADIVAKRGAAVLIAVQDSVKAEADESSAVTYYGSPETISINEASYAVKKH